MAASRRIIGALLPVLAAGAAAGDAALPVDASLRVHGEVHGVVVDRAGGRGIEGARVALCSRVADPPPVVVNRVRFGCVGELAVGSTDAQGRFVLRWEAPRESAAHAALIARAAGFVEEVVDVPARGNARIALTRGATLGGLIVDPRHRPVADARFGWLRATDPLEVRSFSCCSSDRGRFDFGDDAIPPGEITVFAVEPRGERRIGMERIVVGSGDLIDVTLTVDRPAARIEGRLADASGVPLFAGIDAQPEQGAAAIDRALLALTDGETDARGRFELLQANPGRVRVEALVQRAGDDGFRRLVARTVVAATSGTTRLDLTAAAERVVACTLVDGAGRALPMTYLGASSIGSHRNWGHSGDCMSVRVGDDPPSEIRFVWPDGASRVRVSAKRDERGRTNAERGGVMHLISGSVMLDGPTSPCRIVATD
jgi:hypothetical protein